MPHIQITLAAANELRRRLQNCGVPNAVVVIFRLNKGADLRRGDNGEVVWTVEQNAISWSCDVVAIPESETFPSVEVDGIRFAFSTREFAKIKEVQVTLLDGDPHARVDA